LTGAVLQLPGFLIFPWISAIHPSDFREKSSWIAQKYVHACTSGRAKKAIFLLFGKPEMIHKMD